jgi:hypothetical protein
MRLMRREFLLVVAAIFGLATWTCLEVVEESHDPFDSPWVLALPMIASLVSASLARASVRIRHSVTAFFVPGALLLVASTMVSAEDEPQFTLVGLLILLFFGLGAGLLGRLLDALWRATR